MLRIFRAGPVKINTLYMHHIYKPFKVFGQNYPLFHGGGWGKGGLIAQTGCPKTSLRKNFLRFGNPGHFLAVLVVF